MLDTTDSFEIQEMKAQQAAKVLYLLFFEPNMTVVKACELVGITERQYRYWIHNGGDTIERARANINNQQKEMLLEIAAAKHGIITQLIKDALDATTSGKDRASILTTLNEIETELQTIYHARPGIEEEAQAFLKHGPDVEPKKSRLASIDIEQTETGITIGINEERKVIDGTVVSQPVELHLDEDE